MNKATASLAAAALFMTTTPAIARPGMQNEGPRAGVTETQEDARWHTADEDVHKWYPGCGTVKIIEWVDIGLGCFMPADGNPLPLCLLEAGVQLGSNLINLGECGPGWLHDWD